MVTGGTTWQPGAEPKKDDFSLLGSGDSNTSDDVPLITLLPASGNAAGKKSKLRAPVEIAAQAP